MARLDQPRVRVGGVLVLGRMVGSECLLESIVHGRVCARVYVYVCVCVDARIRFS